MPSQLEDSDRNDRNDTGDAGDSSPRTRPQTWRERHALKLLGVIMVAAMATVIVAQVAC